jgi:hypothetical protein
MQHLGKKIKFVVSPFFLSHDQNNNKLSKPLIAFQLLLDHAKSEKLRSNNPSFPPSLMCSRCFLNNNTTLESFTFLYTTLLTCRE